MSPKSSTIDRKQIIDEFYLSLGNNKRNNPQVFNIDSKGTITLLTDSARKFFLNEWELEPEMGDNCFEFFPVDHLEKFSNVLSHLLQNGVPGEFTLPSKISSCKFYLSPVFTGAENFNTIQILIKEEKLSVTNITHIKEISAEQEQQFIFKLIKSVGRAKDVKYGLSKMIGHISKFLNFDFAEAWEVGYDKHILYKSASFSKEKSIAWDDEGIKSFKKGKGLPGITWQAEKVEVWEGLQNDDRFLRNSTISRNKIKTAIGVPVIHEKRVIAILTFFSATHEETSRIKGFLEQISFHVSAFVNRRITENQLNNMFRFSPNLIAVVGMDGYLKKVNPSFIRIFGFDEENLLNNPFSQFLHKEDKLPTYERLREVVGGLRPRSFQNRCRTNTGEYRWISWTPSEVMEEEGVVHIFGTDISYIKKTNLELLKYRNIVESSKDGIGLYTLETGDMFFNQAFRDILGYSQEELKESETVKMIYANNTQAFRIFHTILKGRFWEGDLNLRNKEGKLLEYHFSGGPIVNENEEIIALFGLHTDISERKKYESSLREYGNRLNNVLESITDAFFSLNNAGEVTYWNKAAEVLLKVPREKILGKNLWGFFPLEKDSIFYQNFLKAKNSNNKISFEHFVKYLGMWIEVNVYPGKDGLSSYFKDISARKEVEEEIRKAKERYELISKATREAIYDWDVANNCLEWSDSYYEIYGYERIPARESLSQWEQQIHPEDRDMVLKQLNAALESKNSEWICKYKLIQANRKIAVVLERGFIIRNEKGKPVQMIGSLQDITTLKQNERALEELNHILKKHSAELIQSNAELEQFAYIASHDLQEPLRMVTSFLNLLEKKYEDKLDEKARQYIYFATDGASRMKQINSGSSGLLACREA